MSKFPKTVPPEFVNLDEGLTIKDLDSVINFDILMADSETPYYQSNLDQPRMSARKVRLAYFLGARGGGKTTAMEEDSEYYYNEGLSCWYLWSSRSNENVFIAVNRNDKIMWNKTFKLIEYHIDSAKTDEDREKMVKRMDKLEERLRCNCSKAYPINWLVPNYYDFKGVTEYNTCWADKEEFDIVYEDGWLTRSYQELSKDEKRLLIQKRLKKPKHLLKTDLIRICPFTIPNGAKNKEIFEREFLKYALEARKEHRWLVMNPLMFLKEEHKFQTIGYVMERVKFWVDQYFQPNTPESVAKLRGLQDPVPRDQWTKIEKSWDKICMILGEIRTIAPPHKYSPEQKSNLSKRPIIDAIPELRHLRIWLLGDLQSPDDLNDSVRHMADHVVIKRSSEELLGDEWSYFYKTIEKQRKDRLLAMSHGKFEDFKKAPQDLINKINSDLPSISQIPKNKGYIVYPNGEFYLETFSMASFHHKRETETLQSVTGITWKIKEELMEKEATTPGSLEESGVNSEKRLKNYDGNLVLVWCVKEFIITGSWDTVLSNLTARINSTDKTQQLPVTGNEKLSSKHLSNKIRKDKKFVEILNFAKNHKEMSSEQIISSFKL